MCHNTIPFLMLLLIQTFLSSMQLLSTSSDLKLNEKKSDTLSTNSAPPKIGTLFPFVAWRSIGTRHMQKSWGDLSWNRYVIYLSVTNSKLICMSRLSTSGLTRWIKVFWEKLRQLQNVVRRSGGWVPMSGKHWQSYVRFSRYAAHLIIILFVPELMLAVLFRNTRMPL